MNNIVEKGGVGSGIRGHRTPKEAITKIPFSKRQSVLSRLKKEKTRRINPVKQQEEKQKPLSPSSNDFGKAQLEWESKVTDDERESILHYQYSFENVAAVRYLQSGVKPPKSIDMDKDVIEDVKKWLPSLDKVMKKAPNYNGTVFRTMKLDRKDITKFTKGKDYKFTSVTSTSGNKDKAEMFLSTFVDRIFNSGKRNVLIEMKVKTAVNLGKVSVDPRLKEILLRKNTTAKIMNVEQKTSKKLGKYYHVTMEE